MVQFLHAAGSLIAQVNDNIPLPFVCSVLSLDCHKKLRLSCKTNLNRMRLMIAQYFSSALIAGLFFFHYLIHLFTNPTNNALAIRKTPCCCSPCHSHLFEKKPQPWQRWIDVLICLFNRRFPLQLPSCLSLVLLHGGGGRACIFMVINTCTQSFNLPYLSHVTVWLHCLIWVSFNLSCPRLEINEGRKRRIWISYSVGG